MARVEITMECNHNHVISDRTFYKLMSISEKLKDVFRDKKFCYKCAELKKSQIKSK